MFHSVTMYEMLSVISSRSLCFTALLCMKCCQWFPADRYVSQRYSVWNVVSDFLQIFMFHIVTLYEMLSVDFQQIAMFHSVTLYEMLSVTSSWSLCFTALLCMKCCQWLPADRYVSQRYSVWNVVSDFQQIFMFHSVTLYEMLSVTSSRSLCFTVLLCMKCCQWFPGDLYVSQRYSMKCCQWLPADLYVLQRYSLWNVVNDFQQIFMFHSVTLYEMLSVTSSKSLCFTALLFTKCCQWLPADRYVSQCYSVWNVVSDSQQTTMFHNVTLYAMLSVTSSISLRFTALICVKCCQWLPADLYVSQRYSVWNVVSDFQQIFMFHSITRYEILSVTSSRSLRFTALLYEMLSLTSSRSLCFTALLYEMLSVTSSRSLCFTALLFMKCCQWLPADLYVSQRYSVWNVVSDFQQIFMFHSVTLYEMLSVVSSRSFCFTALLLMKCCQWLQADLYVSQRYSLWNVVSDFQQIFMFHSVTMYEMLSVISSRSLCFTALLCMKCCQWLPADLYVSHRYSVWNVVSWLPADRYVSPGYSVWNVVSDFQLIVMFHSVTLYEMLSVTSSWSLRFTALLCMKCCQWLPADRYVSQRYSLWNVVSDFQQIFMFHSVTLYEMLSVTSSRSLCFTVLLCMKCCQWFPADLYVSQRYSMKCCQWLPADLYVLQRYSLWNVVNDFQQIFMFHSVTLYEMLSVTSSRSLCFTALLFTKCCQWLPADLYVSQCYSVWNVVSDFQQIILFHSVTLNEMLSVTSSRSLCFTALLFMKCCQWLPADLYVSQRYSVWNVVSDFQQIFMFHSVTLYEMLSVTSSRSLCFTALLCMKCCQWFPADRFVSQRYS